MKYVIALALGLIFNASANLMMKAGMNRVAEEGGVMKNGLLAAVVTVATSPVLIIGLTCFGLNAACYMFALQSPTLKISIAYPIVVGGGYAIIAVAAFLLLSERLTFGQWVGVILVLAGVIVIATQTPDAAGT